MCIGAFLTRRNSEDDLLKAFRGSSFTLCKSMVSSYFLATFLAFKFKLERTILTKFTLNLTTCACQLGLSIASTLKTPHGLTRGLKLQ